MRETAKRGGAIALETVAAASRAESLAVIAALEPDARDGANGLALIGPAGPEFWAHFAASPEAGDGEADPLDRWSRRIGERLAAALGATALFPFGGPPYQPFLRWMLASGVAWPSPLGMLIHAERGLWMSCRFALAFDAPLVGVAARPRQRPCDACAERPCLSACPVDAFTGERYDVEACAAHLRSAAGRDCLERGCRARRACPVGQAYAPTPAQAAHHMAAFLRGRSEPPE